MIKNTKKDKNIFLFVGEVSALVVEKINAYNKANKLTYKIACLCIKDYNTEKGVIKITTDFSSESSIKSSIAPYKDQIISVTARGERNIPFLQAVIPFLNHLKTPSVESLTNTTDKVQMRRKFVKYNPKISPNFTIATDTSCESLKKISSKIGYPAIVKPSGLASSLLVSICYDKEELKETLKSIFTKIDSLHKEESGRGNPQVLVEEFMEGNMYAVDAYVNNKGNAYFLPLVASKSGRTVGFDDFFEYIVSTPTHLNETDTQAALDTAKDALAAVGLTNSTAHIELMKTPTGWKIVELGPRIGAFRIQMYQLSYGVDHSMNDLLNKMGRKPKLAPKKPLAYTAVIQFYSKKEGRISKMLGIKKVKKLESFYAIFLSKKIGDIARFAKNGGKPICKLVLSNENESDLLADIRRTEQYVKISTLC